MSSIEVLLLQQMDRLTSASSPSDALDSIQSMKESFLSSDEKESMVEVLSSSEDFMKAVCRLLSESKLLSSETRVEDGSSAICEFLQTLLSHVKKKKKSVLKGLLASPKEGQLVHALLDVVSSSSEGEVSSTRIRAMKLLSLLVEGAPTLVHAQIISAPDGLNRIMDLLLLQEEHVVVVRNEALLLCQKLAKTCCKFMIFSEGFEKVFHIALSEGEEPIVQQDCLMLCLELVQNDGMGPEVFLGSRSLVDGLASFLDLRRRSSMYQSPPSQQQQQQQQLDDNDDDDDDLDDILDGKQKESKSTKTPSRFIPYLTNEEAKSCEYALSILQALISPSSSSTDKIKSRQESILSHSTLIPLLADMALYTLPPLNETFVSGVPTIDLQLLALQTLAQFASCTTNQTDAFYKKILEQIPSLYLHNVNVLERVMYLICTGNGVSPDKLLTVSNHALSVLRATLTSSDASVMMLHTLAPLEDNKNDIPVVQRLANTCAENLYYLSTSPTEEYIPFMTVNVVGAAGALGVFLTTAQDSTTRDMLIKVQLPSPTTENSTVSLMDCILSYFEATSTEKDETITIALLRFLAEWVDECTSAIHVMLKSPSSVTLGTLSQQQNNDVSRALTGILMGLSMEYMQEEEVGGWSKESIMKLLSSGNIGKLTQLLERVKQQTPDVLLCDAEIQAWKDWYADKVRVVRRRAIEELTGDGNDDDDQEDDEMKKMSKFVAQQSLELEQLRDQLKTSQWKVEQQASEIKGWEKQIMASNPTQLDDLLEDYKQQLKAAEAEKYTLETSVKAMQLEQENVLQSKQKDLEQLRQQLEESTMKCKEAETEEKTMKDELEGLSCAYTNLETEYQSLLQQKKEQDDKSRDNNDAMTNNSSQENEEIKNENQKLKKDLQAANEWMSMAVKRTNALQSEVKKLQSSSSSPKLEHELITAQENVQAISSEKELLQSKFDMLQSKFDQLLSEQGSLNDSKTMNLERQLDERNKELEQKDLELKELKVALDKKQQPSGKDSDETLSLKQNLKKISAAYKDAQAWMANAVKHNETLTQQCKELKHQNGILASAAESKESNDETLVIQLQKDRVEVEEKLRMLEQQYKDSQVESAMALEKSEQNFEMKTNELLEKLDAEKALKEKAENDFNNARSELMLKDQTVQQLTRNMKELSESHSSNKSGNQGMVDQISSLNGQLTNLETRLEAEGHEKLQLKELLESKNVIVERLEVENKDLTRSLMNNENDFIAVKDENERLVSTIQINDTKFKEMANEVYSLRNEVRAKDENINSLRQNVSELSISLQTKESELSKSLEETREIRETLNKREQEFQELNYKHKLASPERLQKETELSKLRSTLENIRAAANNEQKELQEKVHNMQRELGQKEKVIAEMEDWLKSAQEQQTMDLSVTAANDEEKAKLRDKIEQLTKSGIAAKQWMDNSMKRHESMTNKIVEYKTLNSELNDEVLKLRFDIESSSKNFEEQIRCLTEKLEFKESKISDLDSQIVTLNENADYSKAELKTLQEKFELTNQSIAETKAKLRSLQETNKMLEEEKKENSDSVQYLTQEIESLQLKLEKSEENAKEIKESMIKNENFELELARNKLEQLQDENTSLLAKNSVFEADNSRLESELSEAKKRAENYDEIETDLFEKENALADAEADLSTAQNDFETLKHDSEKAIENWKERVDKLELKLSELTKNNEEVVATGEQIEMYEKSIKEHADAIEKLQAAVNERDEAISTSENEYEDALKQWQERVQQLEETIGVLEQEQGEATDAIALWESRCQDLEEAANNSNSQSFFEEKSELSSQIDTLKTEIEMYEKSIKEHADAIEKLQAAVNERDEAISTSENEYEDALKQWQERVQQLEETMTALEKEKNEIEKVTLEKMAKDSDEMRATICQLEDELGNANESLQKSLTDKISERATDSATDMLRRELKEVRETLYKERESLITEQELRAMADQEISNLKSDLYTLVQANEYDENADGRIRELTSKAMDKMSQKERNEIQKLKIALDRAMQDLQASRHSEKNAQEKAASSRLHASVCEQELQVAKSDLSFLKQAVEEARESESNARSSLEYRISALEDDREIMIRSHADELEHIQAELAQMNMEKERLIYSLSESEKANSALVYSTSMERSNDVVLSDTEELEKLRLEKAQLLAAVSEGSLKTERRIREAIAAHASSSEAEVMLERELRESAELALEDSHSQIESLKKSVDALKLSIADKTGKGHSNVTKSTNMSKSNLMDSKDPKKELKRVEEELLILKKENDNLKAKYEQSETEANMVIDRLKEQYRMAMAKTREIEQNIHFEAAVTAEVSRLRSESSVVKKCTNHHADDTFVLMSMNHSDESKVPTNRSAQENYDFIVELKAAVKEERILYHELLTEHEDLLALVAQQDLERTSLHSALVQLGGNEALQRVLIETEEKANEQFGRYIKIR